MNRLFDAMDLNRDGMLDVRAQLAVCNQYRKICKPHILSHENTNEVARTHAT